MGERLVVELGDREREMERESEMEREIEREVERKMEREMVMEGERVQAARLIISLC